MVEQGDDPGDPLRTADGLDQGGNASGEVREPILSVVSIGTRVPLRIRLSMLNQPIMAMYLRVTTAP